MIEGGRTIDPEDVLGPPGGGRKLVVIGDTETTDGLSDHVADADLLVIEATFLDRDARDRAGLRPSHRGRGGFALRPPTTSSSWC